MKKCLLIFALLFEANFCFSQKNKVYKIILDNKVGIPYSRSPGFDYIIGGFEVDNKNNFYFISENNSVKKTNMVAFSNGKRIYSKYYDSPARKLHICEDKIYSVDLMGKIPVLLSFSKNDGTFLRKNLLNTNFKGFVSALNFNNCMLGVESIAHGNKEDEYNYYKFGVNGKFINKMNNMYEIENEELYNKFSQIGISYLGRYKDKQIYIEYNLDKKKYEIITINKLNNYKSICIENHIEGDMLIGEDEFIKLRNGSIFFLTQSKNYALITEVPLDSINVQ